MNLKPIGDRIVIKLVEAEEKTASEIVLPSTAKEKPQIAKVIAVSDSVKEGKENKDIIKVSDKVIFSKYAGTEIKIDGVDYIVVKVEDVLAIVE